MHIIQALSAWNGAREWSRKPWSWYLVNSHAFYKEWAEISRICVARVNHKRVVYWFFNYRKMKDMLEKHEAWHGAIVWPHLALVKIIWSGLCRMHALHKMNHHRGSFMVSRGKSPRLKGNPNFLHPLPMSFFLWWTYTLQITMLKFGTFPGLFTILRRSCAFSRH